MKETYHRLYRESVSLQTLIGFFFATLIRWPVRDWLRFWCTKKGKMPRRRDGVDIALRVNRFREKVIDAHMVWTTVEMRQYESPPGFRLARGEQVIDIGGHIGAFAVHAASLGAEVVTVEPAPENFRVLLGNTKRYEASVIALPLAVAGENGTRTLALDPLNSARHGFYGKGQGARTPVEAVTLSRLFERCGKRQCDFLKLDAEGAEYEIIAAAPMELLASIQRIAMEFHLPPYFGLSEKQANLAALTEKLRRSGFTVRTVYENRLRGLLFARREQTGALSTSAF